jgi:hypothetical protein
MFAPEIAHCRPSELRGNGYGPPLKNDRENGRIEHRSAANSNLHTEGWASRGSDVMPTIKTDVSGASIQGTLDKLSS